MKRMVLLGIFVGLVVAFRKLFILLRDFNATFEGLVEERRRKLDPAYETMRLEQAPGVRDRLLAGAREKLSPSHPFVQWLENLIEES